jgi:hypothetical protein
MELYLFSLLYLQCHFFIIYFLFGCSLFNRPRFISLFLFQIFNEPIGSHFSNPFQRAWFFEKMGSSGNNFKLLKPDYFAIGLLV